MVWLLSRYSDSYTSNRLMPAAQARSVRPGGLNGPGYTKYLPRLVTCKIPDGEGGGNGWLYPVGHVRQDLH